MLLPNLGTETLFDCMPDAVVVVDEGGDMVWINSAGTTLLGFDRSDIIGRPVEMLVPASARMAHSRYLEGFKAAAKPLEMNSRPVLYAVSKSGKQVPVSISIGVARQEGRKYFIAVIRDASNVQRRIGEVLAQAECDPLTGIGNRFHLTRKLEAAKGFGRFAFLYLDLAKFKPFNDLFGHAVGDEVLKIVARRIQTTIRGSDVTARIGGDEFAILLTSMSDPTQMEARAHTVANAINAPLRIGAIKGVVTAHIGGAMFPDDANTTEDILIFADRAMYQAKKNGEIYCRLAGAVSGKGRSGHMGQRG